MSDDLSHGKPTFQELHNRIWADLMHYGGPTLIRAALVWDGYLGAMLEWGLISVADHELLTSLLPHIEDNPVIRIFTGWEDEDEPTLE